MKKVNLDLVLYQKEKKIILKVKIFKIFKKGNSNKIEIKGRGKFFNGKNSGLLAWENEDYIRTNNYLKNYGERYKKDYYYRNGKNFKYLKV
jgi:hypothetical protein